MTALFIVGIGIFLLVMVVLSQKAPSAGEQISEGGVIDMITEEVTYPWRIDSVVLEPSEWYQGDEGTIRVVSSGQPLLNLSPFAGERAVHLTIYWWAGYTVSEGYAANPTNSRQALLAIHSAQVAEFIFAIPSGAKRATGRVSLALYPYYPKTSVYRVVEKRSIRKEILA